MAVTINVNALSLVHKGSSGITINTLPDVCKTPPGPIPLPYPNIAYSKDLAKGTKTVEVDGGNMAANFGSEFSVSIGDEPGVAGGVKSGTQLKEATWITYSMDVFLEGKGACRLTDKMWMNHQNTVSMNGEMQEYLELIPELAIVCQAICQCEENPIQYSSGRQGKQECVRQALDTLDTPPGASSLKAEISYNMTTQPPTPFMSRTNPLARSSYWQGRAYESITSYRPGTGMVRRPDVVIVNNPLLPPTQDNIKAVVEVKFPPDDWSPGQQAAYQRIAGPDAPVIELSPETCGCDDQRQPQPDPIQVPEVDPVDVLLVLAGLALLLTPIPGDEALVGGGAAARLAFAFGF